MGRFVTVLLSLLLILPGGSLRGGEKPDPRNLPNLLLITFDTTRADRIRCYGFEGIRTPNIDRLANEGVLFEDVYAQAPQTMPNHTSLFTGLYTITHNVLSNGQALSDEALTLAEILRSMGYETGAVVAAAPLMKEYNLHQGFKHYNDDFQDPLLFSGFKTFLRFFSANKINIPTSRPANRVARLAVNWLTEHGKRKKPFFLWVHFFDPHHPYDYHPDFDRPDLVVDDGEENSYGEKEVNYINEIEFADYYMGKILAQLDRMGLAQKTLTVFTADHGESLGEHEYRGHRQEVFQNVIRVPLIFRWPGHLPERERLKTPSMTIDIMPTILGLMEIPSLPDSFQGENLFDLPEDQPRKIYSLAVKLFTKSPIRKAILYGQYKYIEHDDPAKTALYDIASDPGELVNLLQADEDFPLNWETELASWFERYSELDVSDFTITPQQLERLKSLGYVQ